MTENGIWFQSDRSPDDIQIYSDISLFTRSVQLNTVVYQQDMTFTNRTESGACGEGPVADSKRDRGML